MINVPEQFRQLINTAFPPGNKPIFEEWFYDNYKPELEGEREYLPVFWTGYYVNNNYGNDKAAIALLQAFIDALDRSKKYYTIVQYDDGILNDISGLDIKVFAMSGPRIDYALPLLCHPHKPLAPVAIRDIYASFVGSHTHPIRGYVFALAGVGGTYISDKPHSIDEFTPILNRSVYALCPRGYGQTSFRICEALQYGAIPVYISDEFIEPQGIDFNTYGVKIPIEQAHRIIEILLEISPEKVYSKRVVGREVYRSVYSFNTTRNYILKNTLL